MKKTVLILLLSIFVATILNAQHKFIEKKYFVEDSISGLKISNGISLHYFVTDDKNEWTTINDIQNEDIISFKVIAQPDGTSLLVITAKEGIPKDIAIGGKNLRYIEVSDFSSFLAENFSTVAEDLVIVTGEVSSVLIKNATFNNLIIKADDASRCQISGNAKNVTVTASDVSNVNISNLDSENILVTASSAATVSLNNSKSNEVIKKTEVATVIKHGKKYHVDVVNETKSDSILEQIFKERIIADNCDENNIFIGPFEITPKTHSKKRVRIFNNYGKKFNGHWGGVALGFNGLNNADFNMNYPENAQYMDLRFEKSVAVYLNIFELNLALSKNKKWGMLSGLGFEFHNYRFSKNTYLDTNNNQLAGYYIEGAKVNKSKLEITYITVPLIFEFQTNSKNKLNSLHAGIGIVGGARIESHTKIKFDKRGAEFYLIDPITSNSDYIMHISSNQKLKKHDDFYLTPLKLDAAVTIGWGKINLFATYSLTKLIREDRGCELYPWSIGISLCNW